MTKSLYPSLKKLFWGCFSVLISLVFTGIILFLTGTNLIDMLFVLSCIGLAGLLLLLVYNDLLSRQIHRMREEDYDAAVQHYMTQAANNPRKFASACLRFSRLGSAYIFFLIAFSLCAITFVCLFGVKTNISPGIFSIFVAGILGALFVVLRSLYIPKERPEGLTLIPEQHPNLIAEINEVSAQARAPHLDQIFLSHEHTLGVVSIPYGFGFKDQHLLLAGGLTLNILTNQEWQSLLAHELAHICHQDTQHSYKINHTTSRWERICQNCQKRGTLAKMLLIPFAQSFSSDLFLQRDALSKHTEFAADAYAAKVYGPHIFATALKKFLIFNEFLESPLDQTSLDVRTFDLPPKNYYTLVLETFAKQYAQKASIWNDLVENACVPLLHSHPSFSQRMAKLHVNSQSLVLDFFPDHGVTQTEIDQLLQDLNEEFHINASLSWRELKKNYLQAQKQVDDFVSTDNPEQNQLQGAALEELGRFDEALALYDKMLAQNPNDAFALYHKGFLLLTTHNDQGIDLIQAAIALDDDYAAQGLECVRDYLFKHGLDQKRDQLSAWANQVFGVIEQKNTEIQTLLPTDTFVPAVIEKPQLRDLYSKLLRTSSIAKAYLVSKQLFQSQGCLLVLGLIPRFSEVSEKDVALLHDFLVAQNLSHTFVDLGKDFQFKKIFTSIEGSDIYKHTKSQA